ncbi:MAG: cellulose biosynthesis cyclic di-GMP-binding regulatory protein BcsB [Sulfurovum sp.]|nr:cellulose biosynthesis cyclic di-GMP-binding regulatory protein BcsB [Sulfurovum sp.]
MLYKQIGLDINKSTIPPPAQPYTAKRFLPLDQKIYFKELGYSTTLLKGQYPSKVVLDFKVYPDNFFDSSDQMKLSLHTVFPTVVRDDSVVNIYLNQKFAKQIDIVRSAEESESKIDIENLFDWDSLMDMPAYLVGQGYNRLSIDFSLIPKKENFCEVFNTENLVATLLDDSYLILPKAERWIELPYLQLIPNSSYPYSIYPDLQETTILLTNKSLSTIAASMNFIFYLTQQIDSYPYYLNITNKVNSKTKVSHIIAFGTVKDKLMQDLSQDAPLVINEDIAGRTYPFIEKFVAYKNILDEERTQKYSFRNSTIEKKEVNTNLVLQMIRSPYDTQKTIMMAIADNDKCLENGIFSIFQDKNRGKIKGDLLIYNYKSEIAKSFNVKDKYIISDLNWLDTISLVIAANPLLYLSMLFLILIITTYILRSFLLRFKEEHHKDAE